MAKKKEPAVETFYPSEIVDIDSIRPWPTNYNDHPDQQLQYLRGSLRDFGQVKNVIIWGDYIVAGHGLVEAAKGRGWRRIEVKRLPANWSEIQVEAVLIADNRLAQLSTANDEKLADMLQRVRQENSTLLDSVGYNGDEVDTMLRNLVQDGEPPNYDEIWQGMPEFEQKDAFGAICSIKVHFASEEDVAAFAKVVGQAVSTKSTYIWYPKQERENLQVYRAIDAGDEDES